MKIREDILYDWALDWQMGYLDESYLVDDMNNYCKTMGKDEVLSILKSNKWYVKSMDRAFQEEL